jgi:predicted TIM-barrel fold metal-dependent hydrolase
VNVPRIDGHVHLYRRVTPSHPRAVLDVFPADAELLAETFIARMDKAGIDRAVVVSVDHEPRYLLECLEGYPARFHGIGVVDPVDPDPAETFRRLHTAGVQGMRTGMLAAAGRSGLHERARELLGSLEAVGAALWFYGRSDQLPALGAAAAAFPRLPIVLNHLAFFPDGYGVDAHGNRTISSDLPPATLGCVRDLAAGHPNVMVVISGQYAFSREPFPHDDLAETTRLIVEAFGPERCLWGSDHPASDGSATYREILSLPRRHLPSLSDSDLAWIMGGTADHVFRDVGR